eukprot:TRINITY_DN16606_c0_g1_i2.p1 TRINITY_DN16606_c0_g1~~TRINITY_DN16606_c0_g1_i2.p1  ORF type:complete len:768 (+),score=110.62 TRINITY_DN16606_c0_g1_i2:60-2363(+)
MVGSGSPSIGLKEPELSNRLTLLRSLVAQPIPGPPWVDQEPALVGEGLFVGNKHHAANVKQLVGLGVTAVLNCASSGISRLPIDDYEANGISYRFTNVRQDNIQYPILHDAEGTCSEHLRVAEALYSEVQAAGGKVLFFCVAGQNRSATLVTAVLLLHGNVLEEVLRVCSKLRPFVLENVGFQRQLLELESMLLQKVASVEPEKEPSLRKRAISEHEHPNKRVHVAPPCGRKDQVEIELLVPGVCTFDVRIPHQSTIPEVKKILVDHVNTHFLSYSETPAAVWKAWLVLAMFGFTDEYDLPLEEEAVESNVQVARMRSKFGLVVETHTTPPVVHWTAKCRFAVVVLSVIAPGSQNNPLPEPWYFQHHERPGAPATLLENNLSVTRLRGWDFVTGHPFCSKHPIVFSFSEDTSDKKAFMNISTSKNVRQQFSAPGEGGILGWGANAIIHRVPMRSVDKESLETGIEHWDAAVKRSFCLRKMLASLEAASDAGTAKRMRLANSLNEGRVLYYHGLGLALASNSSNHDEYKFEVVLLARYEEEFALYTLKNFLADYITDLTQDHVPCDRKEEIQKLQAEFSLIKLKGLLVSLLNSFRDLTLMGVQSFDFNHLSHVLVSRDGKEVHLINVDGDMKGAIEMPSGCALGSSSKRAVALDMPALDIELSHMLPLVVNQLLLGKGRSLQFVTNTISRICRMGSDEDGKSIIKEVIKDNFFSLPQSTNTCTGAGTEKHISKVTEWLYAVLRKRSPWSNWTNDIYHAMRCIDHLPMS